MWSNYAIRKGSVEQKSIFQKKDDVQHFLPSNVEVKLKTQAIDEENKLDQGKDTRVRGQGWLQILFAFVMELSKYNNKRLLSDNVELKSKVQ